MKLSIIIPTIGRESLNMVLEALSLSNNFDQIKPEVIVVFDGVEPSPDLPKSGFIQVRTPKKAYAAGARNLGIERATGDVLVFIGDDTIPAPDWLQKIHDWHVAHPEPEQALLGRVKWTDHLAGDPFHQWLEKNAQFDYARLDKGKTPDWRHFYTSNISVKRAMIGGEKFSDQFSGWGFEDTEFGYRLAQKGLKLHYEQDIIVRHDDPQTFERLVSQTISARKNALVFEGLHPELKILPRGLKRYLLCGMWYVSWPLSFIPEVKWWRLWKKSWFKTPADPS